jgi:hypothetical protein
VRAPACGGAAGQRGDGGEGRTYERPDAPLPPLALRPGEPVTYRGGNGDQRARHGTVERLLDDDQGAVVVRFEDGERTALAAEALEPRAA